MGEETSVVSHRWQALVTVQVLWIAYGNSFLYPTSRKGSNTNM